MLLQVWWLLKEPLVMQVLALYFKLTFLSLLNSAKPLLTDWTLYGRFSWTEERDTAWNFHSPTKLFTASTTVCNFNGNRSSMVEKLKITRYSWVFVWRMAHCFFAGVQSSIVRTIAWLLSYEHSERWTRSLNTQNSMKTVYWMKKYLSTTKRITSIISHSCGRDVYSTKELKLWVQIRSIFHFNVGEFTFKEDRRRKTRLWISFNFDQKNFFPKFELLKSGCGLSVSAAYLRVFTVFPPRKVS